MKLEFNFEHGPILTPKQVDKLERDATKWAHNNLESQGEYIICDDATADHCCKEYIEESLCYFNAEFLSGVTGLDEVCFSAMQKQGMCEDANPAFAAMVKGTCGLEHLVEQAIAADGRGHFLSSYDGEEHELKVFVNRKAVWLYAYRTN